MRGSSIKAEEIQLVKKIGEGVQANVWQGKCRGSDVAVKVPKYDPHWLTFEDLAVLVEEVDRMRFGSLLLSSKLELIALIASWIIPTSAYSWVPVWIPSTSR